MEKTPKEQKGKKRSKTNKIQEGTANNIAVDLELKKRQLTEEEQEFINEFLEKDEIVKSRLYIVRHGYTDECSSKGSKKKHL